MQLTAKLIQLLPLQTGTGKNGEWKKQDVILETDGQYPKKVCVSVWGDKINEAQLQVGNQLIVDFDVESREFNGKWYAWKVEVQGVAVAAQPHTAPTSRLNVDLKKEDDDVLPF